MPSVNQVSNLLPSGGQGIQIPLDIKQHMLAEQLAQETVAAPKAPYTSKGAGLVSALTGGIGVLMEGMDAQRVMQGNRNANATAMESLRQQQVGPRLGPAHGDHRSAPRLVGIPRSVSAVASLPRLVTLRTAARQSWARYRRLGLQCTKPIL